MFAAREEAVIHCYNCVHQVARRLGIEEVDWKGTDEILGDLAKRDAAREIQRAYGRAAKGRARELR